jgi:hypothetical protein
MPLLIHKLCSSLQHVLSLLSLYFHQSLPDDGSQQCPMLPCSRSYWLVTVPQLSSTRFLFTTPWHRLYRKHLLQQLFYWCVTQLSHGKHREHLFPVSPLVRVKNLLPSNEHCLHSHYLATGLYATLWSSLWNGNWWGNRTRRKPVSVPLCPP